MPEAKRFAEEIRPKDTDGTSGFESHQIHPALQVYRFGPNYNQLTAGAMRIFIEYEVGGDHALTVIEAASRYETIVTELAAAIVKDRSFDINEPASFIGSCWRCMRAELGISYGRNRYGFLSESLATNRYNCDTAGVLAFDVARDLGIEDVALVLLSEHALLKVGRLYFEITARSADEAICDEIQFRDRYRSVAVCASTRESVQSTSLLSLGVALKQLGRLAEALECAERAIALEPNDPNAHINRASALNGLRRFEEAQQSAERAIELDLTHAKAHHNHGIALNGLGRVEEALASICRAIELDPNDAAAHRNCAVALNNLSRFEEALESADRAIRLDRTFAKAHNSRGIALRGLHRFEEARKSFERATKLDPSCCAVYGNRGTARST
jgi:Flp pilus assembly protein TadD